MLPTEPLEVREKSISDLLIEMSRTCSCRNEKYSYILIGYIDVLTTFFTTSMKRCSLDEGISWGKIHPKSKKAEVHVDVTLHC